MTTVLEVYEDDHTTLVDTVDPGQWARVRDTVAMSLAGGGELVVPRFVDGGGDNPVRDILTEGRIVRVVVDGIDAGAFAIEQPDDEPVSRQEEPGEVTVYKGREPMARALDKVQWIPDRGLDVLPFTKDRYLHWAADRYRDDDPGGPNGAWPFGYGQLPGWNGTVMFGRPPGYIDTAGPGGVGPHVVGPFDTTIDGAPVGRMYYRQRDELDDDWDALLVQAFFDDFGVLYWNGYPVLRAEGVYKGQCQQAIIPATAGDQLIAGWVQNANAQRMGVSFAAFPVVDGLAQECVIRSDASKCRILAFPAKQPGFTGTEVIRLGVDEANDRGMLPDVDTLCTFISASDTDSQPLTELTDLAVQAPGDSLLTTCRMLSETILDVSASRAGLELNAWKRGTQGDDKTATVQLGKGNTASIRYGYDFAEKANVAIVTVEGEAPFAVEHPDLADQERSEIHLDYGKVSKATGRVWARRHLDILSNARRSIEITLGPEGPVPLDDYDIADWISVGDGFVGMSIGGVPLEEDDPIGFGDGEPVRVAAIGHEVDSSNTDKWTVECEQPKVLLQEQLAAIMRRQLPGTAGGRTLLPVASEPSFADNRSGSEQTETWSTGAAGTVNITRNGVELSEVSIATSGGVTPTIAAERKCPTGTLLSFTVDGVDGFPAGWPVPAPGLWIQHVEVSHTASGRTIVLSYTTGVQ